MTTPPRQVEIPSQVIDIWQRIVDAVSSLLSVPSVMINRLEESELEAAFQKVNTPKGLLTICSKCKKIRDDKGYWVRIEKHITEHSQAEFSHGICLESSQKLYPP